jgi:hypothetical protein
MGRQNSRPDDATDAQHPIDSDIVADVAERFDVGVTELDGALAAANDALAEVADDLRDLHDVISDDNPLIVLSAHMTEWDATESGIDHNLTPAHDSPALVLSAAHDRQAKRKEYSAFGGRDEASSAVGHADAVIVETEDN